MKANDVLTLANKALIARRYMSFYHEEMRDAKHKQDAKKTEVAEKQFMRFKHEFCTFMDCIAIVSRDAGNEFRREGWGRSDI